MRIEERIGARVREERERRGWSQEVLGQEVGRFLERSWSGQTVSVAEKGGRDFGAVEMLAISMVFNKPVASFYREAMKTAGQEIQLPSGHFVKEREMRRVYGLPNAEAYRIAIEMRKLVDQVELLGEGEA